MDDNPWAPGGAMSQPDGWWTPVVQAAPAPAARSLDHGRPPPSAVPTGPPPMWRRWPRATFAAAVAVTLAGSSLASRWLGDEGQASGAPTSSPTSTPSSTPIPTTSSATPTASIAPATTPTPTSGSIVPIPVGVTERFKAIDETSLGTIHWVGVTGDAALLPARVLGAGSDGRLVGGDDGGLWASDGGTEWERDDDIGRTELGGADWLVDVVGGRHELQVAPDGAAAPVAAPVHDGGAPEGRSVGWQVRAERPTDVLVEIGGTVFALIDRREAVDWGRVLGYDGVAGYRVRVTAGDDEEIFRSVFVLAVDTVELTATRVGDRIAIADETGDEVWSVAIDSASGADDVLTHLRSRTTVGWYAWGDDTFVPLSTPWASGDIVEIAPVGDRILAVATAVPANVPTNGATNGAGAPRVWSTADGSTWEPVDLPATPSDSSPIPMSAGPDEAVLTISDGERTTYWATSDGRTFERLADVPGVARRSRGDHGWVAADPRSSPVIRVSQDGVEWEEIDIGRHVGFDAARWDGRLDAIAFDDRIVVTATVGDRRTVLVGRVVAPAP